MLGDLFDTEEQLLSGVKEGQIQSSWDRLPRSCADQLPMPELSRKQGYPTGLKNQGATCYLNSLLQILYHTPELRKIIFDLPLCVDSVEQKTDFLTHPGKHKFMLGFQRLFSEMSICDKNSLSTQFLKDAFGWEGAEHVQQHDIEEAMKVIFDTFQRALVDTTYEKNIKELFRGIQSQYKTCRNCTITSERLEDFYGLTIQVKNIPNLSQSMMSFFTAESMDGNNQIFCETCQSKQDMWLGTRLKTLPNILSFTFRRFQFDFEKMDRVKVNDFFSFDLQYNFQHFLEESNVLQQKYELYGVLIHRGSAHGGHYISYIRDLMHQSDWQKSLEEAKIQEKKLLESIKKDGDATEEQKSNREKLEKENQLHPLKEPQNKKLLQNWFQLDDSICRGIEADKITSKYEGADSAYIVFYRRKNLQLPKQIKVPKYYEKLIKEDNEILKKQRDIYEVKRKQIKIKIDGQTQVLQKQMKVNKFIQNFDLQGYALVNQGIHNQLPYYPMAISSQSQFSEDDTLQKLDIIHESFWKRYELQSEEYKQIKDLISKDKLPFIINILFDQVTHRMVFYQDQTLSELRIKIEHKLGISYEKQVIKVVTPYKQTFVTDDLSNDDVLLTKLGFIHESQGIVKELKGKNEEQKKQVQKQEQKDNLYCFIIQRDDQIGIKRMYFDKRKTLQDLLEYIHEAEALPKEQKRRLRNMNGDRLFYQNQYSFPLQKLNLEEEMIKIRIERGEIPVKGDICVKVKMQSQYQPEHTPPLIQQIFDPNATITEVKKIFCEMFALDHENHRVYMTDWMGEPVRTITKQKQSIFDSGFGGQQTICIRDLNSPIGSELLHFQIFQTTTGSPEDISNSLFHFKIEETKTLLQLKKQLLHTQHWEGKNLKPKQLRLRQMKRDYMLGVIFRDHDKTLKNMTFNNNKLVVQVMNEEESLTDDDIVLILKKRNREKRVYEGIQEFIFSGGKNPRVDDLKAIVCRQLKEGDEKNLVLVKYFNYNFEWMQISEKQIDKFLKGKANEKKQKKSNKKKRETQIKQNNPSKQSALQPQSNPTQDKKHQQKEEVHDENKQKQQEKPHKEEEKKQQGNKKGEKNKRKEKNEAKSKDQRRRQECLNLKRAPILLKDGDWIGYGFIQDLKGDDYQTDEDLTLRALKKESKHVQVYRKDQGKGFQILNKF